MVWFEWLNIIISSVIKHGSNICVQTASLVVKFSSTSQRKETPQQSYTRQGTAAGYRIRLRLMLIAQLYQPPILLLASQCEHAIEGRGGLGARAGATYSRHQKYTDTKMYNIRKNGPNPMRVLYSRKQSTRQNQENKNIT